MKKSKMLSLLLAAVLCLSLLLIPAFAQSAQADGLELTLSADKASYAATENIVATIQVKNISGAAIQKLSVQAPAPAGYRSAGADSKAIESLAAGASESLVVTYAATADADPTGDNSVLAVLVAVIAAAGMVLLAVNRRSGALVLAAVLVLGVAAIGMPASAAGNALEVSTTVQVDGKDVTLRASVSREGAAPVDPPADVPVDLATALGSTYVDQKITFGLNHALFGYVSYALQPDGTVMVEMFGQSGEYGKYGIVTEGGKQYVLATETKFIENGKVLPSNVTKWELTEANGLKVLKVAGVGDATEVKEVPVDIWSVLGTVRFEAEITFGTEDNSSMFTFKTDGTVTGVGVGAGYSHYGIVEKDGKKYVAMFQTSAVTDGKALASKVEMYELAGEGAAQTVTYLFLGIPFVLTVK